MINFSSFVKFANKIDCQTTITSECVEKSIHLQYMSLTHAPDTQPQYYRLYFTPKNVDNINFVLYLG